MVDASQKISNSSAAGSGEGAGSSVPQPDPEQLRQLLQSREGRALLQILQADGGSGLRAAAEAMRAGNMDGVKEALSPLLAGTEAGTLTRSLEGRL